MILVTGATGKVGRSLVAQLLASGEQVRAVARDPRRAELPTRAEVVRGDLADPWALHPHLTGVDAVFLLWPFATSDAARTLAPELVKVLTSGGAHLVYLSAQAAESSPASFWALVEDAVAEQAPSWVSLRPTGFATNTLGWADSIRSTGEVRWPSGKARRSLIHEADIAAVAARCLVDPALSGIRPVLTGPEALSQREQVQVIGSVIGRTLRWQELSREQGIATMTGVFGDPVWAAAAVDGWAAMVDRPETVTGEVERLTGKPARSFRAWALDHADDFA